MSKRLDDLNLDGLKVYQETNYFCFGIDSVLLANFVKSNSSKNVIVDLCSGSGVISIILSKKKEYRKIFAVELQDEMFELLDENIKLNNLENKVITIREDVKRSDRIKEIISENLNQSTVDIIVCNPPYKKKGTGVENENSVKYIARHEIKCELEDIFKASAELLKSKGKLYLVHKPDRLVDLLSIARKYRLEAKNIRFVHSNNHKAPSIVLIEYIKDGGNEVHILDPLIEYDKDGNYTDEIKNIYEL
jgi:tRNA1Val (adenine37-N6)-methyltransferase